MIKRMVGTSNFPYAVDLEKEEMDNHRKMTEWCTEQFGNPFKAGSDSNDTRKWIITMFGVRFKKQEYQNWFLMRWS